MNEGGDVLSALGWGLRKYAWLVALFVIALGALVPYLLGRGADVYDAQAQVGPKRVLTLNNLDPLPRIGDSVFNNGAVADAVRAKLKLPASAAVVPQKAELVAAQDNVVLAVIGHGSNPAEAKSLADTAASAFAIELNKYSLPSKPKDAAVGEFLVQQAAPLPTKPVARLGGGPLAVAIGVLAGLIVGIGAVALLLVARRPVLEASGAQQATGVPVFGGIRLPRKVGTIDEREFMGVAALCRRLLASSADQVMLTSVPQATPQLHQLGSAMESFLERRGKVRRVSDSDIAGGEFITVPASPAAGSTRRIQFIVADKLSLDQVATLPASALTLLVVPRGIRLRSLRETAAEYFSGGPAALVLVERARWYQRLGKGRKRSKRRAAETEGRSSSAIFPSNPQVTD